MTKYNLYRITVDLVKGKRTERRYIYIAARNVKNAFSKTSARLSLAPHGIGGHWNLTGHYELLGKVFI